MLNGLIYLGFGLVSRHLSGDLLPGTVELRDILYVVGEYARLQFPRGEAAQHQGSASEPARTGPRTSGAFSETLATTPR